MEFINGEDIINYLLDHGHVMESEAQGIFQQLISAVQYYHQKSIIHEDQKPGNLLSNTQMNIKIKEFGQSNEFINHKVST